MGSERQSTESATPAGTLRLGLEPLSIDEVVGVARHGRGVELPGPDSPLRVKLAESVRWIRNSVDQRRTVYGVNTGFGGMSGVQIDQQETRELQLNLIWFLKAGAGNPLPDEDVRGAMLLRVRSFLHGASAARWELLERLERFLNCGVTPVVREFGSIGASGDLVPLASIAGAAMGLSRFHVTHDGRVRPASEVLRELGLEPIELEPKEGLAMVNGTSMSTAMAASCLYDAQRMLAVTLGVHALMIQALKGMDESFAEFVHGLKPHPGQLWAARCMRYWLHDSQLTSQTRSGTHQQADEEESLMRRLQRNPLARRHVLELLYELRKGEFKEVSPRSAELLLNIAHSLQQDTSHQVYDVEPIQDRYSVRCLPQYLGPIRDGLATLVRQVELEMNSASDNPLVDGASGEIFHGGNFLGQYTAVAMDQLRYYIGLLAKHLDAQIALMVAPEFSEGLSPSLVGNLHRNVNMGLKGLQISGNSIMPLLSYLGNPLADRYPTHAEQFNQNINSLSFGSAYLTRQSVNTFRHYLAISLVFAVQAVDLRTWLHTEGATCDGRGYLSPASQPMYEAIYEVLGKQPRADRPCIRDDNDQALDEYLDALAADLARGSQGRIGTSVAGILEEMFLDS